MTFTITVSNPISFIISIVSIILSIYAIARISGSEEKIRHIDFWLRSYSRSLAGKCPEPPSYDDLDDLDPGVRV